VTSTGLIAALQYNRPASESAVETTMDANSQIFSVNPYEDHPSLTQIEADLLWEYAKLNQHIKDVRYTPPQLQVVP
jgi:DASH complex subunit DAD3